ncbi:Acetyltransferase, GNAT family [Polaromonas sp. OV174]|uniref:GNAT family N-acetyltransferase n=1 Tax=Polaromonas sp. OV174 TaxID=1855300 RepID=UPI0008EAA839|nr:GNAT family N-acetyltransferase [Polaromonas sp. OV174]SFC60512.1 Acetyltransferase, GNAT family [Polaromonas sp. OV174]
MTPHPSTSAGTAGLRIRNFRAGDEAALRAVFHASIHGLAGRDYSPEQLNAWAPLDYDAAPWGERMRANQPFVAEIDGEVVGYADLQASGYIDHFFVAATHAGRGVGAALMAHIHQAAARGGITRLFADVSLRAEPFFSRHGFVLEARQQVERRGVVLRNARMYKLL